MIFSNQILKKFSSGSLSGFLLLVGLPGHSFEIEGDARGTEIARKVYERPDGDILRRNLKIELIDAKGEVRQRSAVVIRQRSQEGKKTVFMYDSPRSIRGTAFLSTDYFATDKPDDQFLFLPALKRERRIPSSERGDYFLGTDFTYEDVRSELKFDPKDFFFEYSGELKALTSSTPNLVLVSKVKTPKAAGELGYSRVEATIDPATWMIVAADYYDLQGKHFKTTLVEDVREIEGVVTAHKITVKNLLTGHTTRFTYSEVEYLEQIEPALFDFQAVADGPRRYK